jgi:hypothetical protein
LALIAVGALEKYFKHQSLGSSLWYTFRIPFVNQTPSSINNVCYWIAWILFRGIYYPFVSVQILWVLYTTQFYQQDLFWTLSVVIWTIYANLSHWYEFKDEWSDGK